jgi:hypothetical protein
MWRAEVVAMQGSADPAPADAAYLLRLEGRRPLAFGLVLCCGPFAVFGGVQTVRTLVGPGSGVSGWLLMTLFPLLCLASGLAVVRRSDREQHRAVPGGVILAVEETGLFLGETPARRIPWTAIAELVVFRRPGGTAVDLHLREPKLRHLTAAVHHYAPQVNVWDAGLIYE